MGHIKHILKLVFLTIVLWHSSLYGACDFTATQDLILTPSGTHNAAAGFTQLYLLTDAAGIIQATSTTGNFGPQAYGNYYGHALNYQTANAPTPLPIIGANVNAFTGGCFAIHSDPLPFTVCEISATEACENSGDVIRIVSQPDFNQSVGFNQTIVIVDNLTGLIVSVKGISNVGTAIFTTQTGTGDLPPGDYRGYAVNYQSPETPASLGLTAGSTWTGSFGAACASASAPITVTVTPAASCAPGTSILSACENSAEVISVHIAGHNTAAGFNEYVVIVDSLTGLIAAIQPLGLAGSAVFTTTSGTGDLTAGFYKVYSLNFEDPATLAGLGALLGNTWPVVFGSACADTSLHVRAIVTQPGSCIFPLDLIDIRLSGEALSQGNQLDWHIFTELSSLASLELLHSQEGITFETVYTLSNPGNHQGKNHFLHGSPFSGTNFYRLKVQDREGQTSYSNTVRLESSPEPKVVLYPNPSDGSTVNLLITGITGDRAELSVIDALGRQIWIEPLELTGQETHHSLIEMGQKLATGIYFVQVSVDGQSLETQRLMIR